MDPREAEHGQNDAGAPAGGFFSPQTQDAFWASFHPDIRALLSETESRETWTYSYDELPGLFTTLAGALPRVVEQPLDDASRSVVRTLIPLLASMPFRQCMAGLAWLDARADPEGDEGWGVVCYVEAANIEAGSAPVLEGDGAIAPYARIVVERVRMLIRCRIAAELFSNIHRINTEEVPR